MTRHFDLKQKKVIDVRTAEQVGFIRDIDIDFETGKIKSVTIPRRGIFGLFSRGKSTVVPWDGVVAIGSEFVIVSMNDK